tara:strand:+ start:532 stop:1182 length:651 start_codon:yes stop_codon:yes gene_type:complete
LVPSGHVILHWHLLLFFLALVVDKLVDLLWLTNIVELLLLLKLLVWILVTLVVAEVLGMRLVLLKSLHELLLMDIGVLARLELLDVLTNWLLWVGLLVETLTSFHFLNLVWLLELLLKVLLLLLLHLLHVRALIDWLETLKFGIIVHAHWLTWELLVLELLLSTLINLIETLVLVSWILDSVLCFLLLLELHHLLLSLRFLLERTWILYWLKTLSH